MLQYRYRMKDKCCTLLPGQGEFYFLLSCYMCEGLHRAKGSDTALCDRPELLVHDPADAISFVALPAHD